MNELKLGERSIEVKDDNNFHLINHYVNNILLFSNLFNYTISFRNMSLNRGVLLFIENDNRRLLIRFETEDDILERIFVNHQRDITVGDAILTTDNVSYKEIFEYVINFIE